MLALHTVALYDYVPQLAAIQACDHRLHLYVRLLTTASQVIIYVHNIYGCCPQPAKLLVNTSIPQVALAQLWSIERHGLLSNLSLARHPELTKLAVDDETLPHLARLPKEELVLRWVNQQIGTYLAAHPEDVAAGRYLWY